MSARERWDVFCRVVDHYGDVGIAWRLARQLARQPDGGDRFVRLFVDDLASFARIEPRIDRDRAAQAIDRVEVRTWPPEALVEPADVVIELLGCRLPDAYLDAMARRESRPLWIDFEHLSAEPWVDGFHGLPSPHPTLPLVKHFFYPGFNARTGGLLFEPGLDARRAAFVADRAAIERWQRRVGLDPDDGARRISLFAYDDAPVFALLDALAGDPTARWSVVVPDGVASGAVAAWRATDAARGAQAPTVTVIPFVEQDDYDRLLWTCDVNVVRGEDSFVRAQAAGRPFVWQAYRQSGDAHAAKLSAFLDVFDAAVPEDAGPVVRRFFRAWNGFDRDAAAAARDWLAIRSALDTAADRWRRHVLSSPPLIERLLAFVGDRRRSP